MTGVVEVDSFGPEDITVVDKGKLSVVKMFGCANLKNRKVMDIICNMSHLQFREYPPKFRA